MNTNDAVAGSMADPTTENAPSADFICAISEFLDTDPNDLLVELGYHHDEEASSISEEPVGAHA